MSTSEPLARLELEHVISAHYRAGDGRNPYHTGYGAKIRTEYRLMCRGPLEAANGDRYRMRRVYVMCYSNAGSAYVLVNGTPHLLTPEVEALMVAARESGRGRADRPETPEKLTRDMPGPLFDSMRRGHLIRCGHELDARLESTDGEVWNIVRSCC